jgi:hypothetical protein
MRTTRTAVLAILLAATFLGGCASPGLYQWGNYDQLLYQSYKNPETVIAFRKGLEVQVTQLEATKQKVPPGVYAEIGTLYFQSGDRISAVNYYKKERDAWPESKGLMDALISNADKGAGGTKPEGKS